MYAAHDGGEHWEVKKARRRELGCEYAAKETDGWILNFVFVGLHCEVTFVTAFVQKF